MHTDTHYLTELKSKNDTSLGRHQLDEVEELATELRGLLVRHHKMLKECGVRKDIRRLEAWLEAERHGPAPASVISESGISWLEELRDRLKLSANEMLRLEDEGGNPAQGEQCNHIEDLLKAVRKLDNIINHNTHAHARPGA